MEVWKAVAFTPPNLSFFQSSNHPFFHPYYLSSQYRHLSA
jgi:hypothetical protein